jgi:DNA-binding beta-propeller fold protein YncE
MRFRSVFAMLALGLLAPAAFAGAFKTVDQIKGADGPWDYAIVDADNRRLLVARGDGVMAVDLDSGAVTPTLVPGKRVHGVVTLPGGRGLISNGDSSSATLFQAKDGKVLAEFPAGAKADAVVREPKTGLVVVMNSKDGTATLIDPGKAATAGTMSIGGTLEFAAADGQGHVFVNVEDKNEIVFLDIPNRKVTARHPLPDCDSPTGLALDNDSHTLLAACGNGKASAISAIDGHPIASLPIGKGPDAVLFDAKGKRFLVPCGGDGILVTIEETPAGLKPAGSAATARGARTGAFDATTGKVYLPTADFAPAEPGKRPAPIPGSFHILVLSEN